MSYSFYIDPIYNDFRISGNHMVLTRGSDTIVQQIKITLMSEIGSWFLNGNYGLPWITATGIVNNNFDNGILGSNYPDGIIQTYISKVVLSIPGVRTITELVIDKDIKNKKMNISLKVVVENSDINSIGTESVINVVLGGV
jgi:hypothetical protein